MTQRKRHPRKSPNPDVGARIAALREAKGIDRDRFAKKLRFHPLKMYRLESGKTHLTADDLRRIADELGVSAEDIVGSAVAA